MANPQTENGFTKIANELLDNLVKIDLLGAEYRIVCFIIRKTYGYNKKTDYISLTQFELGTGLSRPTVVKSLKNLSENHIIIKENSVYSINKDWEKWGSKAGLTSKALLTRGSKHRLTKTSKGRLTHKRNKEMIKDNTEPSSEEVNILIKSFEGINPAAKNFYARNPQRNACKSLISTYGFERVKSVIEATIPRTNKIEYMPTITTPIQLFDKWSSLEAGIYKLKNKAKPKNKVAF